ncbi:hypothetical protein FSP39_006364 [Pinctada imbricata]|uniref:Uncharacterized protein n=1 Tax=Pinctada imbricata TaxID=66713 RepID=A0AA88Y7L4_PINIB|nr:hypothetical protein FSP39_006364 [Pinctada imbricata]
MNIENCRTMVDVECVRTDSELFETEEILIPEESQSVSSDEYLTATSHTSSRHSSRQNLRESNLHDNDGTVALPPDTLRGDNEIPHCHFSDEDIMEGEDPLFSTPQSATLMSEFELENFTFIDGMDTLEVDIEVDKAPEDEGARSDHIQVDVKNEDNVALEAKNENSNALNRDEYCSMDRETIV